MTPGQLAKKIFEAVETDLRDRRGIRHEWDMIDEEIQKEIRDTNVKAIRSLLVLFTKMKES